MSRAKRSNNSIFRDVNTITGYGMTEYDKTLRNIDVKWKSFSQPANTDFFIKSVFNESQVISVYYLVKALEPLAVPLKESPFDFHDEGPVKQAFRWKALSELQPHELTFETDQRVAELLVSNQGKIR